MRIFALLLSACATAAMATQAYAQSCPIIYSGFEGERAVERICSAILSFNQNGVPGVMADDCEGDDCCDDDDPTWLPAPPFSAIISMGEWGVSISRLSDNHESEIRRILEYADILDDYYGGYGERRRIPSLEDNYSYGVPDDMRYLAQREPWIERAIANGNLVYYYLRRESDRH
ncbi:hypothetical protein [Hoeflea poritis]|uniref:Uncharacterized protein n=1 Tax=Hoeflea poritis TaxID=2993659 RepID=A0ABT4VQC7_9HYPH|nr:hypothetical protein [Hoeflea poritis]MDA4846917.1 hypothetical protein [Hoeflea poritis]